MSKLSTAQKRRRQTLKRVKKQAQNKAVSLGGTANSQLSIHRSLPKMSHALLDFAMPWIDAVDRCRG